MWTGDFTFFFGFSLTSLSRLFHSRRANRKVGRNIGTPGKPPDTHASRTWLVSHVASAGFEPMKVVNSQKNR